MAAKPKKADAAGAEKYKEIRKYCKKATCGRCKYRSLCCKVPGNWTDEEIERAAAE